MCTSNQKNDIKSNPTMVTRKPPKLLLLGAGGGGKSTLFRHIQLLSSGLNDVDRKEIIPTIHQNIFDSILLLCQQCESLRLAKGPHFPNEALLHLQSLKDSQLTLTPANAQLVQTLWKDPSIQHAADMSASFTPALQDNARYFLDRVSVVSEETYIPTDEDLVRCCARTTGFVELKLSAGDIPLTVYDVGGQRAERKKWVHCFEDTCAFLYVAGLTDYDLKLVEDPKDNRLIEDLKLFEGLCDMFPSKPIMLLLSKADILQQKISNTNAGHIESLWPDYKGNNSYESIVEFITEQYMAKNKYDREIALFTLDLTDRQHVATVMANINQLVAKV